MRVLHGAVAVRARLCVGARFCPHCHCVCVCVCVWMCVPQAYADYNDLMTLTEDLISGMVKEITGGYVIKYHPNGEDDDTVVDIDFTPPFKRISLIQGIEEAGGFKVPLPLESTETRDFLDATCKRFGVRAAPSPFLLSPTLSVTMFVCVRVCAGGVWCPPHHGPPAGQAGGPLPGVQDHQVGHTCPPVAWLLLPARGLVVVPLYPFTAV